MQEDARLELWPASSWMSRWPGRSDHKRTCHRAVGRSHRAWNCRPNWQCPASTNNPPCESGAGPRFHAPQSLLAASGAAHSTTPP
eukprot:12400547-Alexandrium_andersonii.AAC.1